GACGARATDTRQPSIVTRAPSMTHCYNHVLDWSPSMRVGQGPSRHNGSSKGDAVGMKIRPRSRIVWTEYLARATAGDPAGQQIGCEVWQSVAPGEMPQASPASPVARRLPPEWHDAISRGSRGRTFGAAGRSPTGSRGVEEMAAIPSPRPSSTCVHAPRSWGILL